MPVDRERRSDDESSTPLRDRRLTVIRPSNADSFIDRTPPLSSATRSQTPFYAPAQSPPSVNPA